MATRTKLPPKEEIPQQVTNESLKLTFKELIAESLLSDKSMFDEADNRMKDVETVKIIIKELLAVKKHLPSTTNLTTNQVHGLSKLKTINKIFKSPLIDEYIYSIAEYKRSETKEPFNMLKGFFDLASNVKTYENTSASTMDRILGRKGSQ